MRSYILIYIVIEIQTRLAFYNSYTYILDNVLYYFMSYR